MTLHKSLRSSSALKRARNVLSRAERLGILEGDGRWTEGTSVFGLPKVRSFVMKRRHAKAAKKEEGAPGVEGVAAEGAPGAAAAPAGKGAPAARVAATKAAPAPAGKAAAKPSKPSAGAGRGAR